MRGLQRLAAAAAALLCLALAAPPHAHLARATPEDVLLNQAQFTAAYEGGAGHRQGGGRTLAQDSQCTELKCTTIQCGYYPVPNYRACKYTANSCSADYCFNGVCMAGLRAICPRTDWQCQVQVYCRPGVACAAPTNKPDGTACEYDGNKCTKDVCKAGKCTAGPITPCSTGTYDQQCQVPPTCNPLTGTCSTLTNAPDGTRCEYDGNPCTWDVCKAGKCTRGSQIPCGPSPTTCDVLCQTPTTCDPSTGKCLASIFKANGTPCEYDGDKCTPDTCQSGRCTKGTKASGCSAAACNTQCLTTSCNPVNGDCVVSRKPDGTSCEFDGNACTIDTCKSGVCVQGVYKTCANPGVDRRCVITSMCHPRTGQCTTAYNKPDGTACEYDNNKCTLDTCVAGKCTPGPRRTCNIKLLDHRCQTAAYCKPWPSGTCMIATNVTDGTACENDGDPCSADTCRGGRCVRATYPKTPGC